MTDADSLHGDPVFNAMAEREQKAAAKAAMMVTRSLRALGFDFVLVRVSKIVSRGRSNAAPGATAFDADDRMLPCLPLEADELRSLAQHLDDEFRRRGTFEATEGYVEDVTHRITDFEGPKQ